MSDQDPPGAGSRSRDRAAARAFREGSGERPGDAARSSGDGADGEALLQGLSLLWPGRAPGEEGSRARAAATLPEQTAVDLEVSYLVQQIAPRKRFAPLLDRVLRAPLTDERDIRYRQDVVNDILGCPQLRECCRVLAEQAIETSDSFRIAQEDRPKLFLVATELSELQDFIDTVEAMSSALRAAGELRSSGLALLRSRFDKLRTTKWYTSLRDTVASLLADIRGIRSVTVGINLDPQLRPVEATLLSINRERFLGSSVMASILGRRDDAQRRGIADLHSMLAQRPGTALPIASPLFRDLAAILDQLGRLMEKELAVYSRASVDFTTTFKQELVFYASAVSLVERLESAGLPTCTPVLKPAADRISTLRDSYNVNLAFRVIERDAGAGGAVVRNDADLADPFRIAVLTGPNNGGKSVFLQSLGLAQLLAQAGMRVPAAAAELSIADVIATHYPIEERPDKEVGRLHEEAARLRDVLATVTRQSLFLSSETFSSTGAAEAAYLLADVIRALQKLGCRAVFSTHLHELADTVERDGAFEAGETRVANLVALFEAEGGNGAEGPGVAGKPTYRVVRTRPRGRSYAETVARGLGIQYEQLVESMEKTGRLPRPGA